MEENLISNRRHPCHTVCSNVSNIISSPFPLFFSGINATFSISPQEGFHIPNCAPRPLSRGACLLPAIWKLQGAWATPPSCPTRLATHNDDGSGALGLRIIGGALELCFLCAWDSVLQSVTASPRDVVSSRDSKYTRDNDAGGSAHPSCCSSYETGTRWTAEMEDMVGYGACSQRVGIRWRISWCWASRYASRSHCGSGRRRRGFRRLA